MEATSSTQRHANILAIFSTNYTSILLIRIEMLAKPVIIFYLSSLLFCCDLNSFKIVFPLSRINMTSKQFIEHLTSKTF